MKEKIDKKIVLLFAMLCLSGCSLFTPNNSSSSSSSKPGETSQQGDNSKTDCSSNHEHTIKRTAEENKINATCLTNGSYDLVTYCAECGEELSRQHITVSALGHDLIHHNGKEADCLTNGYKPYDTCSRCEYTTFEEIPAKGHQPGEKVSENLVQPTCTQPGSVDYVYYCVRDGVELSRSHETINPLGHNYQKTNESINGSVKSITYTCSRCGDSYVEKEQLDNVATLNKLKFTLSADETFYYVSKKDSDIVGSVVIPDEYEGKPVKTIRDYAFDRCSLITSIYIPSSVTSIGFGAFDGCSSLEKYEAPYIGGNPNDSYLGYVFAADGYANNETAVPQSLKTVTIIGDVCQIIPKNSFYHCFSVVSVNLSESIKTIGESAFDSCTSLKQIDILDGVETIGDRAFRYNTNLETVNIGKSVNNLGYLPFTQCESLTEVNVDDENEVYASYLGALYDKKLENLYYYPNGKSLFEVSNKIKIVKEGAASYCQKLESIALPDGLELIEKYALQFNTLVKEIYVPLSVNLIEEQAFCACKALEKITLPFVGKTRHFDKPSAENLFGYVFGRNASHGYTLRQYYNETSYVTYALPFTLSEVTILSGQICYYAFGGCSSITKIYLSDGVVSLGKNAFMGLNKLTVLSIPVLDSFTFISAYLGNDDYTLNNEYVSKLETLRINEGCTHIPAGAFYNCKKLTKVELPSTLISIGDEAFYDCDSIEEMIFPDSLTSIGKNAFYDCVNLKRIVVGSNLETIGETAFDNCTQLKSVFLKSTINEWQEIDMSKSNFTLRGAYKYLYSEQMPNTEFDSWQYWHYENNIITQWGEMDEKVALGKEPVKLVDGKILYGLFPQTLLSYKYYLDSTLDALTPDETTGYVFYEGHYYACLDGFSGNAENSHFSNGEHLTSGKRWFLCEPLLWDVVDVDENGNYVLFCDRTIYSSYFNSKYNGYDYYAGGELRKWLDNDFIDQAFSFDNSHLLYTFKECGYEYQKDDYYGGPDTTDRAFVFSVYDVYVTYRDYFVGDGYVHYPNSMPYIKPTIMLTGLLTDYFLQSSPQRPTEYWKVRYWGRDNWCKGNVDGVHTSYATQFIIYGDKLSSTADETWFTLQSTGGVRPAIRISF